MYIKEMDMTDIITVDFESYYDDEIGFRKMTTEEYVRHPEFEVIGLSVKINNGPTEWASGTMSQLYGYLQTFDWANSFVLAHNTKFDGAILGWLFDIKPKGWLDTLSIARALHGTNAGGSLKALADRYGIGEKGTEVVNAKGKHRLDFTDDELSAYGDYCINDTELCYKLFQIMGKGFPQKELKLIDITLRMFIEPTLVLDKPLLEGHLEQVINEKEVLLLASGMEDRKTLMSNAKFAEALRELGVEPPMKESPTTGKQTYAFAKTDHEFTALQDHPKMSVQVLVGARLGVKSTLEETRTKRFISISARGLMPVPIRYYAAHTGRWGGDDKINLQNLPSRGANGKVLKRSIMAPEGFYIYDCDSSQIEARVLAWLAGQDDLTKAFANGEDVYIDMAAAIYGVGAKDVTKKQRFVGKTTILGCGYGMGALRFQDQLQGFGVEVELSEAKRIVQIYRKKNDKIVELWRQASDALIAMYQGKSATVGKAGVLEVVPEENAVRLPSGLLIRYEDLRCEQGERGPQFDYKSRATRTRIYGGKCIENWVQGIARCIIGEQMILINQQYKPVMTVHDSVGTLIPKADIHVGKKFVDECMRTVPSWAEGLPVDCEGFAAATYGDCDEDSELKVA